MMDQKYTHEQPFVYSRRPPPGHHAHTHSFFHTAKSAGVLWTPSPRQCVLVKVMLHTFLDVPEGSILSLDTSYGSVAHTLTKHWSFCDGLVLGWDVPLVHAAYETLRIYRALLVHPGGNCHDATTKLMGTRCFDVEAPPLLHLCIVDLLFKIQDNSFLLKKALEVLKANAMHSGRALEYSARHKNDRRVLQAMRPFFAC